MGQQSKGSNDQREQRSIMIDIKIFGRIGGIERRLLPSVPKNTPENQEVIVTSVIFQHANEA